ncbi:PRTRC system protein B [Sphingomonas oryzagri]
MTRQITQFERTAGDLALNSAILLYGGSSTDRRRGGRASRATGEAFASIHPIEPDPAGQPVIGAGTPLTRAHLRQWADALGRSAPPQILPGNVLVAHPDIVAWWAPAQVRPAFFDISSRTGLRALATRTVLPVPYPAHLFVATRKGLGVYALPGNERPVADTGLLHSPILNVYLDGQLCWGNIIKPAAPAIAGIPDYERAVFDSWSTHPNAGQNRTLTGKSGLVALWDDLATRAARVFPVKRLRPFDPGARNRASSAATPVTLERLIAMETRR